MAAVMRDEFREEPEDVELAAGHAAVLRCRPPRAEPTPRVTWHKDGATLPPPPADGERVFVDETTGSLHVLDARRDDSGLYVCVAENVAGQRRSEPARLTVRGRHWAPRDFVVDEKTDEMTKTGRRDENTDLTKLANFGICGKFFDEICTF